MADLRFIRGTMERAGSFTAVPGWGGMAMGFTALLAAAVAGRQDDPGQWLAVWLGAAITASAIAGAAMAWKARRARTSLVSGLGRKFFLSFLPPFGIGVALTPALYTHGAIDLLPALWLLSYGAAVITGGAFSVAVVPRMGVGLMLFGTAALLTPGAWGDAWMAAGFGGLQLAFGLVIARRHGG